MLTKVYYLNLTFSFRRFQKTQLCEDTVAFWSFVKVSDLLLLLLFCNLQLWLQQ